MAARLDPYALCPDLMAGLIDFSGQANSAFDQKLAELVRIRASQINGCSYCLHMHSQSALKHGESQERVFMLAAWRESPLYDARERAALAWTETLTQLSQGEASDADYALLAEQFSPQEQVQLTMIIAVINAWNRFGAGFQAVHPVKKAKAEATAVA